MKYFLSFVIVLSCITYVKAQSTKQTTVKADSIYKRVDRLPEFPGGMQEFYKYLSTTLRYPKAAYDAKTQGSVIVGMVIEQDGSVTQVEVKKGASPELDAEAVRVMKKSPKWKPGEQNGNIVRVAYVIPIVFSLKPQ